MKIGIEKLSLDARSLPANADQDLIPHIARWCGIAQEEVFSYKILRRSIDARRKNDIRVIYNLNAEISSAAYPLYRLEDPSPEIQYDVPLPHYSSIDENPIVIGAGPGGLFCALILALAGAKPVILERGKDVDRRRDDIDNFFDTRQLNENSNLLYGEGGAGAWSDGKLFTRVKDPRIHFVLQEMIAAGAPEAIAYYSHPHVGSDLLPEVIASLREKIVELGGTFRWDTLVTDLLVKDSSCKGVILENGETLEAPAVIVAAGHSARNFILAQIRAGAAYRMKGFQIGSRIEHPQEFINFCQFGESETIPVLGNAEYNMVSHADVRRRIEGATTFCMCPGGEVIAATPERGRLCTNGMSNSGRDGSFANSAIVTTLHEKMFRTPEEAYAFLDTIERKSFEEGGSDYTCPAQRAADFIKGKTGTLPRHTSWNFGLKNARVDSILPEKVAMALRRALLHFDSYAPGFIRYGTILGTETRVSSPVRFERDEVTRENPTLANLYPVGEGAGLAGGITSSAVDGILSAESYLRKHAR